MSANKLYKASVFSLLFGNAETLRELYGAITGTQIPPDVPISINTLEDVLFMEQINDLSFSIGDRIIVLIEHQSTINPNMPLRLLMYIARVYEKITASEAIYSSKQITIPRPEFIVLYNGIAPYPDEAVLKLSDLYADASLQKGFPPELELTAHVYNINTGHNEDKLHKSENLGGYSAFVDKVRDFTLESSNLDQAMKQAVNWCIEHGILPDFLKTNGSEVVNMLLAEWNMDKALEVRGREAWEDGRREGRTEGRTEGRVEGEARKQKEFIDLLQSGKSPAEILKMYGRK